MNQKQNRRYVTKLLKHTGLKLPVRARLAKFHVNGKASGFTCLPDLLEFLGLNLLADLKTYSSVGKILVYTDGKRGRLTIRNNSLDSELEHGRRLAR